MTLDKQSVQKQNIIRKWSLSILKTIKLMKPGLSSKERESIHAVCWTHNEKVFAIFFNQ